MFGGRRDGSTVCVLAVTGVAALVLSGCSGGDDAPESKRACAVVQADELSDIVGEDMTLAKADPGTSVCTFDSESGTKVVRLSVEGPVEPGLAKLLLAEPEAVKGLGNEAWISTEDVPLDARLLVRKGGALLTVDLAASQLSRKDRRALATEIGEAGVDELPKMKAKKATGERGAEACDRYDTEAIATALGGIPTITPTSPPGSCRLTVEASNLTVAVTPLVEQGATPEQLDSVVAAVDSAEKTKVGEDPAYWIPSPAQDSGGQLDVLTGKRLLQVAVIGEDVTSDEGKAMAIAVAEVAAQPANGD